MNFRANVYKNISDKKYTVILIKNIYKTVHLCGKSTGHCTIFWCPWYVRQKSNHTGATVSACFVV